MTEIWQLLVAVSGTYFITLLVFPGLVSQVQYCSIGDWTPILLVTVFNVPDLIAKVATITSNIYIRTCRLLPCAVGGSTACTLVSHWFNDGSSPPRHTAVAYSTASHSISLPANHQLGNNGLGHHICGSTGLH